MNKFIAIVGSNSQKSTNRELLKYMKRHFQDYAEIELVEIKDLPIFKKSADKYVPQLAKDIAKKIEDADGVIIATPEYDHSVTAVLSSALAWLSYGIHPFVDKPVMITGASYGSLGSSRAQAQLRQILDSPELKARIMPSSEFLLAHSLQAFDDEGNLKDKDVVKELDGLFQDFLQFVNISKQLNNAEDATKQKAATFSWDKD
ncbi:NADPH-dependent FMN reductase [Companilactobacillus pabuli]|uniref:NAD(P)H-dependent oxidoreductase n=1 Tax=Companilactobacillus pabuli TaxID=2714036 RepID=A0A7L7KZU3_9LACO|nr:NADPH-dependent FMN reductase [Companilactobacillus pabuli]AKP04277.1 NADPH-dependent FMN reductase [Companilactobacillus farciminis]AKS52584.1 NADPH-dependent FMN reductase [Companilactobacillus farciminis]MDG5112385.1 NAD(P)H-dependent oxidoreductase [Companilactobacillus pabuli]QMT85285.1 NAD(P)H-dependent oxidoreductase [Companilactobacillus pabuli]